MTSEWGLSITNAYTAQDLYLQQHHSWEITFRLTTVKRIYPNDKLRLVPIRRFEADRPLEIASL